MPQVTVETAWLVPADVSGGLRLVRGPRPEDATASLISLRFHYRGDVPAQELRLVAEVPAGMRYEEGSATGPGAKVSFSVDRGRSFGPAEELTIAGEGDEDSRPARAEDYTHIRWELPGPHPPGLSGLVSYRAVPADATAGPAGSVRPPGR